jgi:5-methylcytosine-specific restriction endonuclease McrA
MKRTPINKVSKKKARIMRQERIIELQLLDNYGWNCHYCGKTNCVLNKHEILFRSHGGDPTDMENCIILCSVCHAKAHRRGGYISPGELEIIVKER